MTLNPGPFKDSFTKMFTKMFCWENDSADKSQVYHSMFVVDCVFNSSLIRRPGTFPKNNVFGLFKLTEMKQKYKSCSVICLIVCLCLFVLRFCFVDLKPARAVLQSRSLIEREEGIF